MTLTAEQEVRRQEMMEEAGTPPDLKPIEKRAADVVSKSIEREGS